MVHCSELFVARFQEWHVRWLLSIFGGRRIWVRLLGAWPRALNCCPTLAMVATRHLWPSSLLKSKRAKLPSTSNKVGPDIGMLALVGSYRNQMTLKLKGLVHIPYCGHSRLHRGFSPYHHELFPLTAQVRTMMTQRRSNEPNTQKVQIPNYL